MTSLVKTEVDQTRVGYVAGLRALADILEAHDEVPLPYEGNLGSLTFGFYKWEYGDDELMKAAMAATRRIIGGTWEKDATSSYFNLERDLHGLKLQLTAPRESVCTRVVVGTHEETVQEPVEYKTVTKTVEDIVWDCNPILDGDAS